MHESARINCKRFFDTYGKYKDGGLVIDIGSQNVNGSLKDVMPSHFDYVGVDYAAAIGVDVILKDPYKLPFEDKSVDIVMSSSCLEHSEMFWLTFLEMARVVKDDGLIYLNVPSSGQYHAYPVDCWRFQVDASMALMNWANRNGLPTRLLEAYVDSNPPWFDMVAVYAGNIDCVDKYPDRIDLP